MFENGPTESPGYLPDNNNTLAVIGRAAYT